jgi:hypothetical protein
MKSRTDKDILNLLKTILRDDRYLDIPLANVIGANITLIYRQGLLTKKPRSKLRLVLIFIYLFLIKDIVGYVLSICNITNQQKHDELTNKIIIEALSNESRLRGLWLPLAEKLGKENCILIVPRNDMVNEYSNFNVISINNLKLNRWFYSRLYFAKNYLKWYKKVKIIKKEYIYLNANFQIEIILTLLTQISLIEKTDWFCQKYHPKSYVSIWDWYYFGSVFCTVFKRYNIPTYTFVHGAIGKNSVDEFIPLNAQYVFTWGNYSSNLFIDNGISKERVLQVGIQRIKQCVTISELKIVEIKKRFNINIEQKILLLAFTAVITESWKKDINRLFELLPDYFFICRPHPSTELFVLAQFIPADKNHIMILSPEQLTLEKCISVSDVVVVDSSTAGFDAIVQNKPVFVLDSNQNSGLQDVMIDAIENNAAIHCKTVTKLINYLKSFDDDVSNGIDNDFNKSQKEFINNYIHAFDTDALNNILNILTDAN